LFQLWEKPSFGPAIDGNVDPFRIIWGIRYIGSTDTKAKIFGLFLIFITIAELVLIVDLTIKSYNMINDQIQQQLPNIQGL
jgi:hypothetical protein